MVTSAHRLGVGRTGRFGQPDLGAQDILTEERAGRPCQRRTSSITYTYPLAGLPSSDELLWDAAQS